MIENTSRRDPIVHTVGSLVDGTDKYVTDVEAAGQRQFVTSAAMPKEGPWDQLEALGFVRGEGVDGDDLFIGATLPAGWAKRSTDHSMWSMIVDQRGVERVEIFYKAAFYDRRAFFRLVDIGGNFVTHVLWGDIQPAPLPGYWALLTDDEKASCRSALVAARAQESDSRAYMADNAAGMEISDRRLAQIDAAHQLLDAADVPRTD